MFTFLFTVSGIAAGVYAGKKRARGDSWGKIASDFSKSASEKAKYVWERISDTFGKDDGGPRPEGYAMA